jgi:hypothetical protein
MDKRVIKPRILAKKVLCVDCRKKKPPALKAAVFLIPFQLSRYELLPSADRDYRVIGVCEECLEFRNEFQRGNKQDVDAYHQHLIYRNN